MAMWILYIGFRQFFFENLHFDSTHMLHGAGILNNICPKNHEKNVGKYTSTMEYMGEWSP